MKKLWLIPMLFVVALFAAGCNQGIPAEEAAPLFINRLVYQEEIETFEENFANGTELGEIFQQQQELFQEHFVTGIIGVNEEIEEEQADEIYRLLMQRLDDTTYEVKQVSETDQIANIVYEIQGISIEDLVQTTTSELLVAIDADNQLVKEETRLVETTIAILKEQIPTTPIKEEPTTVSLQMKQEKGQWRLLSGQEDAIGAIYLSFIAGVSSQEQLEEDLQTAVAEINSQSEE